MLRSVRYGLIRQGCKIFYTKTGENIPNDLKIYQMTSKYIPNGHKMYQMAIIKHPIPIKYKCIFHSKAFRNIPNLGFLVRKYTICNCNYVIRRMRLRGRPRRRSGRRTPWFRSGGSSWWTKRQKTPTGEIPILLTKIQVRSVYIFTLGVM
jgi:hypothetical protein